MSTKYPQGIITPTPPYKSTTAQSFSGVWTLEQLANNFYYYRQAISKSLRFRSSASAYLNRTPASAGNQRTWTWSGWVKRGTLGSAQVLFSSDVGTSNSTWLEFGFDAGDTFTVTSYTTDVSTTSAVFRDPSSWYHIVVAFDSTQSTTSNRCRIYFNGVQQSLTGVGFTLNAFYGINAAQAHAIGQRNWSSGVGRYFDGYMAEINFIDGLALDPSYFGQISTVTGVWSPAPYVGSYGTNGFYLKFTDTTSTTTLCYDYSGNSNNWTPNNISLTAGSTYDSMLDSPTNYDNGGNGVGNYAVLNPLKVGSSLSLSNANLTVTGNGSSIQNQSFSSIAVTSGKWYFEVNITTNTNANATIGLATTLASQNTYSGQDANSWGFEPWANSYYLLINGTSTSYASSGLANTGTFGFAFDASAGTFWATDQNGTWLISGNPATGANPLISSITTAYGLMASIGHYSIASQTTVQNVNFGQRPFAYTPPTGYKALNTQNLPAPSIQNGSNFMAATLWTGTGANQNISNAVNGVSFQPDFAWIKIRSSAGYHVLTDSVRGAGSGSGGLAILASNATDAEYSTSLSSYVVSLNTNGLTVGNQASSTYFTNLSGYTFVGWQWKAGGTAVTNTAGSITSSVSANTTSGFSVVTYTGTGSAGATIGHGLGVAPSMLIVKSKSNTSNWPVYHVSNGATGGVWLNVTNAFQTVPQLWNNTAPTSSVFSVGSTNDDTNTSGRTYVAYCFAAIPGYSAFGSYTGNGSSDGPFVYCGFRPRYIMFKDISGSWDWVIFDTSRYTYNAMNNALRANTNGAEDSAWTNALDILSNGFKLRYNYGSLNTNGDTIIYAAFAENPFNYSLAR